jgi:hypothetical protein
MKRLLHVVAMAGIAFGALPMYGAPGLPVKNVMSSGCLDPGNELDDKQRAVELEDYASIDMSLSGNTLAVGLNAWEYNCGLNAFNPSVSVENGVMTVALKADISPMWCLCHFNFSFETENVVESKYLVRVLPNDSEEDVRLFEADLREGSSIHLDEEATLPGSLFNENTEWVYYNENSAGKRNIFRLRFIPNESVPGSGTIRMSVDGDDSGFIDLADIIECAPGSITVMPLTMTPPKMLWEYAPLSETYDLTAEGETLTSYLRVGGDISQLADEPAFFRDFFNHRMEQLNVGKLERVDLSTMPVVKFTYDNGYEWIQGIGSVSESLPNSLIYPVYSGKFDPQTMTRLMYVQDTATGVIIYGSAKLDPSWVPAGVPAVAQQPILEVTDKEATCRMDGAIRIEVYSIGGLRLLSADGEDSVTVGFGSLAPGNYLLKVEGETESLTRKIMIK